MNSTEVLSPWRVYMYVCARILESTHALEITCNGKYTELRQIETKKKLAALHRVVLQVAFYFLLAF